MQTSLVSGWILVRHGSCIIQLICLWTAHNHPCGSRSLPPLVTSSVLMAKDSTSLYGFKRFFKLYQNEHDSVKETREQGRKPCNIDPKISVKTLICFTTLLPFLSSNPKIVKAFPKTLPTKMKPSKCPAREKKKARKAKEEGKKESEKKKSRLLNVTFKLKNYLKIFLSANAWTFHKLIFCMCIIRPQNGNLQVQLCGTF